MSYSVRNTKSFSRELKRLAKKFPSLKTEFIEVFSLLRENPSYGKPLGMGFFKIRLSIASKGKGKSGGARIITLVKVEKEVVYLTTIYDKSEKENISQKELDAILSQI